MISTFTTYSASREGLQIEEPGFVGVRRSSELLSGQLGSDGRAGHSAGTLVLHVSADRAGDLRV